MFSHCCWRNIESLSCDNQHTVSYQLISLTKSFKVILLAIRCVHLELLISGNLIRPVEGK